MNNKIIILAAAALLFGTACQTQTPSANTGQQSNARQVNATDQMATNAQSSDDPKIESGKTIDFEAPDGVKIVGTFYPSSKENAAAVLMLHQFGGNRAAFNDLAQKFQANGIGVLTIDGRGFGESITKADGSKVAVSQSDEAVKGMRSDVAAAVSFLGAQKNVDRARIGIIGASYGSSLAVLHAADNPNINSVALLSPGTNYFGNLPTGPAIEKYGTRPVLIVAAEDDGESATASRSLDKLAVGDKHQLRIYPKGGHGTSILKAGVGLDELLLEFFKANQ